MERTQRAAATFEIQVVVGSDGRTQLTWKKSAKQAWAELSEGCYVLPTNVTDWSDEELWRTYIQLTEAEAAFRIHKTDLSLRPIWRQKEGRVQAHILVCFLAYVLWKFLGQLCQRAGLGDEPRRVIAELSQLRVVDVILPTRDGLGNPPALRNAAQRPPENPPRPPRLAPPRHAARNANVVEKPPLPAKPAKDLRQQLAKSG